MTRFLSGSFLLLLLGTAIGTAQNEAAQIRRLLDNQVAGWNAGGLDRYMEGYWRSDSLTFVSGGTLTRGYDSTLARYRRSYRTKKMMGVLEFSDLQIRVIGSSSAVASGIWKLRRSDDAPWGRFTLLLEHKTEGWRIVYDHTSSAR